MRICKFAKTIFDRKQQDTHTYPVCQEPREDRNHMFTCQAPSAIANCEKNLKELKQELEELETAPIITRAIIGGLRAVHKGATPSVYSCGTGTFDGGITISGIICDQDDIGWVNFLCGRFSVQ